MRATASGIFECGAGACRAAQMMRSMSSAGIATYTQGVLVEKRAPDEDMCP